MHWETRGNALLILADYPIIADSKFRMPIGGARAERTGSFKTTFIVLSQPRTAHSGISMLTSLFASKPNIPLLDRGMERFIREQ